jgi:hypothetical protein
MRTSAILGIAVMVLTARAGAQEREVELDEVPRAVMEAAKAKFPGASIRAASTEKEEGRTVYELEMTHAKRRMDVTFRPDGTLVVVETAIAQGEAPEAVLRSVRERHPDAKIRLIESVKKGPELKKEADYYELHLKLADGKTAEIEIDGRGRIRKTEVGNDGASNEGDEDD